MCCRDYCAVCQLLVASWLKRRQMVLLLQGDTQFVITVGTERREDTGTGTRCRSVAAQLLGSYVRIQQTAYMFVCCQVAAYATS